MTEIIDRRTGDLKPLYAVKAKEPVFQHVPELPVIDIAGEGDPAVSKDYAAAVKALMTIAWGARMARKGTDLPVFKVMPLEGVWSMPPGVDFSEDPEVRAQLQWHMQVVMPEDFDELEFGSIRSAAARKDPYLDALSAVQFTTVPAHNACAMLHVGPFTEEPATFAVMNAAIAERGLTAEKAHREIYLSDLRRTAPEKLQTILRLTVQGEID